MSYISEGYNKINSLSCEIKWSILLLILGILLILQSSTQAAMVFFLASVVYPIYSAWKYNVKLYLPVIIVIPDIIGVIFCLILMFNANFIFWRNNATISYLALVGIIIMIYFAPTLVAFTINHRQIGRIFGWNLMGALIIPWIIAWVILEIKDENPSGLRSASKNMTHKDRLAKIKSNVELSKLFYYIKDNKKGVSLYQIRNSFYEHSNIERTTITKRLKKLIELELIQIKPTSKKRNRPIDVIYTLK